MMDDARMQELQEDIRYGQMEPITICDGKILDGRNRYAACLAIGAKPTTRVIRRAMFERSWQGVILKKRCVF